MATRTFEKIKRFPRRPGEGVGIILPESGVLDVGPEGMRFRGKKRSLEMHPVHDVVSEGGWVRIDYGEPRASAYLADFRAGSLKTASQNRVLESELRQLLGFEDLPPAEAALLEAEREDVRVAGGHAKMRAGRRTMWIGGGVCVAGALVTAITYAAAEPGGRYFLFWGAVLFGAAQFFIGLSQYKQGQKDAGGRPLPPPQGKTPTAASLGLSDVGTLAERRDVDGLVAALGVNELEVRVQAMDALAALGDPRATDLLIERLSSSRWDVRWSAAEALGKLGDRAAVEPLTRALADENALVRAVAEGSLGALRGQGPSTGTSHPLPAPPAEPPPPPPTAPPRPDEGYQ